MLGCFGSFWCEVNRPFTSRVCSQGVFPDGGCSEHIWGQKRGGIDLSSKGMSHGFASFYCFAWICIISWGVRRIVLNHKHNCRLLCRPISCQKPDQRLFPSCRRHTWKGWGRFGWIQCMQVMITWQVSIFGCPGAGFGGESWHSGIINAYLWNSLAVNMQCKWIIGILSIPRRQETEVLENNPNERGAQPQQQQQPSQQQ